MHSAASNVALDLLGGGCGGGSLCERLRAVGGTARTPGDWLTFSLCSTFRSEAELSAPPHATQRDRLCRLPQSSNAVHSPTPRATVKALHLSSQELQIGPSVTPLSRHLRLVVPPRQFVPFSLEIGFKPPRFLYGLGAALYVKDAGEPLATSAVIPMATPAMSGEHLYATVRGFAFVLPPSSCHPAISLYTIVCLDGYDILIVASTHFFTSELGFPACCS